MSRESGIQDRVQSEGEPGLLAFRQARGMSALIGLAEATAGTITIPAIRTPAPTSADPTTDPENPRQGIPWAGLLTGPWPLLCVLGVQAVLSARLLQDNTAFSDEALYLWAGHLEWAHVLHGMPLPPFATYFSGSPVIYPPIGALIDGLGGLTAARALSGCFTLMATVLLWSTTSRLFGKRAAIHAAGLWAVLGPTLHLGAFATYDAMTLMLVALAASCAVRAAQGNDGAKWAMAAAGALALANATKYVSALWDPVVITAAASSLLSG
jgi:4-amino-4-deoxy-L-arabinose transferase-like glycosyltransferase